MLHWYYKVIIILRKRKNDKETIIARRRKYSKHEGEKETAQKINQQNEERKNTNKAQVVASVCIYRH